MSKPAKTYRAVITKSCNSGCYELAMFDTSDRRYSGTRSIYAESPADAVAILERGGVEVASTWDRTGDANAFNGRW